MIGVYLADAKPEERSDLYQLLFDLKMEKVREVADCPTMLAHAPVCHTDKLLVDWDLLPDAEGAALTEPRKACPSALVNVFTSHRDAHQQEKLQIPGDTLTEQICRVLQGVFNGWDIVIFSGVAKIGDEAMFDEIRVIRTCSGLGLVIGRNSFHSDRPAALGFLDHRVRI